jgi:hypothetical protein
MGVPKTVRRNRFADTANRADSAGRIAVPEMAVCGIRWRVACHSLLLDRGLSSRSDASPVVDFHGSGQIPFCGVIPHLPCPRVEEHPASGISRKLDTGERPLCFYGCFGANERPASDHGEHDRDDGENCFRVDVWAHGAIIPTRAVSQRGQRVRRSEGQPEGACDADVT